MRKCLLIIPIALSLLAMGCPQPAETPTPAVEEEAPEVKEAPKEAAAAATVYDVACGCSLKEVGHCSEWAIVAGKHVELSGNLGLGPMPFCGQKGVKAEIAGEMKDGKMAVSSIKVLKK